MFVQDLDALMQSIDRDGSGTVEFNEFSKWWWETKKDTHTAHHQVNAPCLCCAQFGSSCGSLPGSSCRNREDSADVLRLQSTRHLAADATTVSHQALSDDATAFDVGFLEAAYAMLDTDGDHSTSVDELYAGLLKLGLAQPEEELAVRRTISELDDDHSGTTTP
jgi:hypothetical protein